MPHICERPIAGHFNAGGDMIEDATMPAEHLGEVHEGKEGLDEGLVVS
jgi:hypothetical protein